ncbi:MAG: pentapeptide repeat-containing protein [Alphaproteobacteria bacterium]|nr:pentapeptide repeat-containing protein [Alphaproteobacteria bacterium]
MSKTLQNPDLPPGAIVETYDDGCALRNDGVRLTPAAQNPWYVLATVAGEQTGTSIPEIDHGLRARNCRFWNGWMCQDLDLAARAEIAERMGLQPGDLAPLSEDEMKAVRQRFTAAFSDSEPEDVMPNWSDVVDFQQTYFPSIVVLGKCHFNRRAVFQETHFAGTAYFRDAHFTEDANFREVHFAGSADFLKAHFTRSAGFQEVHFAGHAVFQKVHFAGHAVFQESHFTDFASFLNAHFADPADFKAAHFAKVADFKAAHFATVADFQEAHFAGPAIFREARFDLYANFSDGGFSSETMFERTDFKGRVPKFFHRQMHQATSFTDDPTLWPQVTKDNAKDGKRAYTRLRQIAAEAHNPDLEHFFLRQEMRCKKQLAEPFDRAWFWLYWKLSDYGNSLARPTLWLLVAWLVPGLLFLFAYASEIIDGTSTLSPLSPFGLSFANLFSFLGLNRLFFGEVIKEFGFWLSLLAGMQTVAGVILLFFLGLGLRNRFRLK